MSRIVVAGSFDSKSEPLNLLVAKLRFLGEDPLVIDVSVYPEQHRCDFSSWDVAARGGMRAEDVASLGRSEAVGVMSAGAAEILTELVAKGLAGALVCMGGSNAATVFSHLAPVLPLGIPKILLATVVAGDTRPFMGATDAVLIYPIVDVEGSNAILSSMIERTAKTAVALKSDAPLGRDRDGRTSVAMTMFGVTTPCVSDVRAKLAELDVEAFVFHAIGTGGRTVELFARQGLVDGVVDATITELADELYGGIFPAGDDRLTNAARCGLPQVIAPGAIDMINFGARETVPSRFDGRTIVAHNDLVTLVRTTPQECYEIGRTTALRLGAPTAPTAIVIPLGGVSMLDSPGQAFYDPSAVLAFRDGVTSEAGPTIEVIETNHNINDPEFSELLFTKMRSFLFPPRSADQYG